MTKRERRHREAEEWRKAAVEFEKPYYERSWAYQSGLCWVSRNRRIRRRPIAIFQPGLRIRGYYWEMSLAGREDDNCRAIACGFLAAMADAEADDDHTDN